MNITLKVKKERCADSCPLPLSVLPNVRKGISKVDPDEKSGKVIIEFDEKKISKEKVMVAVAEMKYKVKKQKRL